MLDIGAVVVIEVGVVDVEVDVQVVDAAVPVATVVGVAVVPAMFSKRMSAL